MRNISLSDFLRVEYFTLFSLATSVASIPFIIKAYNSDDELVKERNLKIGVVLLSASILSQSFISAKYIKRMIP
jgi:hypothetical protein